VIAAGGIMDGAGIAAVLALGAQAAQLGTAFVACPETSIDDGYRRAILSDAARRTTFTAAISGRVARSMVNRFTELGNEPGAPKSPAYPIAYDAGKALHAAAKAKGEFGYGAQWAGQAAALARSLPAAELFAQLERELQESIAQLSPWAK
jgi:nitronate monooxygenase